MKISHIKTWNPLDMHLLIRWMGLFLNWIHGWILLIARMRQQSMSILFRLFHFYRCKHWKALFTYISTEKQEFHHSNGTQFFKLLPTYLPKLTPLSIIESLFNDLSADGWVGPFNFIWRTASVRKERLVSFAFYTNISHCPFVRYPRDCSVSDKAPSTIRLGMGGEWGRMWRGVSEGERRGQAWCHHRHVLERSGSEKIHMKAEGLKKKSLPIHVP